MDYPNRKRVKIWGTSKIIDDDQDLVKQLVVPGYNGIPERAYIIHIEAWDINCPKHITQRYTLEEIASMDLKT